MHACMRVFVCIHVDLGCLTKWEWNPNLKKGQAKYFAPPLPQRSLTHFQGPPINFDRSLLSEAPKAKQAKHDTFLPPSPFGKN